MSVLTPPQIAERWKCKPDSVRRLLEAGVLIGFTISPPGTRRPRWRATLDAVLAFENRDPVATPPVPRRRRLRRSIPSPQGPF